MGAGGLSALLRARPSRECHPARGRSTPRSGRRPTRRPLDHHRNNRVRRPRSDVPRPLDLPAQRELRGRRHLGPRRRRHNARHPRRRPRDARRQPGRTAIGARDRRGRAPRLNAGAHRTRPSLPLGGCHSRPNRAIDR